MLSRSKTTRNTCSKNIQQEFEKALDADFAAWSTTRRRRAKQGHGRESIGAITVLHTTEGIRHADAWAG